jgi:hypothetical protein
MARLQLDALVLQQPSKIVIHVWENHVDRQRILLRAYKD